MKIAIMQPYFFPYLGYFQLINAVDIFIVYNDVQYIERGWINRNNFLINKTSTLISIPLIKASCSKRINEIEIDINNKLLIKSLNTIKQNYSKAPFYNKSFQIFHDSIFYSSSKTIDNICLQSFKLIKDYLNLDTEFILSSEIDYNRNASSVEKINEISYQFNSKEILFPSGSRQLYNTSDFPNFKTSSIVTNFTPYNQFTKQFIPGLSILDILIFNDKNTIRYLLNDFKKYSLDEK
ncbi:MAG TPA: WbqC family protein [Vicingus sp.]|nr:WbqC family protein [Vicingus sp.]